MRRAKHQVGGDRFSNTDIKMLEEYEVLTVVSRQVVEIRHRHPRFLRDRSE